MIGQTRKTFQLFVRTFMKPFLFKNGVKVEKYEKESGPFIEEFPRGAYSTSRTVEFDSVVALQEHIDRLGKSLDINCLAMSCNVMIKDQFQEIPKTLTPLCESKSFKEILMKNFHQTFTKENIEYKITILITWNNDKTSYDIYLHYSALPPLPKPPIIVEVIPGSRTHIKAKDSEWTRYRKYIEGMKKDPKSNEIVLVDHEGNLYEGLSSNFFVFQNDKLYTAFEGILFGTIMKIVLEVCQEMSIEVVKSPPKLKDIDSWQEVCISSTSRLLLPIDGLYVHETKAYFDGIHIPEKEDLVSNVKRFTFNKTKTVDLLNEVIKKLKENGTKIE